MGIPFLGEVEKLINEHGSAAILKERIALANDKYAALEAKVADLTAKIAILEAENAKLQEEKAVLQAENERLKVDNKQLTIQIQNLDKTLSGHNDPLDSDKVNILKYLFTIESIAVDDMAQSLNLGLQFVNFHLEELLKSKMVKQLKIWREEIEKTEYSIRKIPYHVPGFAIEQKGRKYLIDNGEV
jgi:chromosome segregation ATPase